MTTAPQRQAAMVDTPVGPLTVVVDPAAAAVVASGFAPLDEIAGRLPGPPPSIPLQPSGFLAEVVAAVHRYAGGDPRALDGIAVSQPGGEYQQHVWQRMRSIPAGSSLSYGALAAATGNPGAARAVGTACARNLVAPFVPCHRVVRSGGDLGNYYYGTDVKAALLRHERTQVAIDGSPDSAARGVLSP